MALNKLKNLFKDVDDDDTLTGTEDEFYQRISDTLTVLATGGDRR